MYIFNLVGAKFRPSAAQAEVLALKRGDLLVLVREPHNPYDSNAIMIMSPSSNAHLGFVPRHVAAELAPRIDAGEVFFCKVRHTAGNQPILAASLVDELADLAPPPIPLKEALQRSLDDEVPF